MKHPHARARARRQGAGPVGALTTATSVHGTLEARKEARRGVVATTMAATTEEEKDMVATAMEEETAMVAARAGMVVAAVVECTMVEAVEAQEGGHPRMARATTIARSSQSTAWSVGTTTVCRLQCSPRS